MKHLVARFIIDQSGAAAIEYSLIAAGLSIAIITAIQALGSKLNAAFNGVQTTLK
jgi:pilus assembly protein Flp/PilA